MATRHERPTHYVSGPLMLSCCKLLVRPAAGDQVVFPVYCNCKENHADDKCRHLGMETGEIIAGTCAAYPGWPVRICNYHEVECTEKPARAPAGSGFVRNCLACKFNEQGFEAIS